MADSRPAPPLPVDDMRPHYVRVIVIWMMTLLALLAFQEYFR
jgi:hypothetical protein